MKRILRTPWGCCGHGVRVGEEFLQSLGRTSGPYNHRHAPIHPHVHDDGRDARFRGLTAIVTGVWAEEYFDMLGPPALKDVHVALYTILPRTLNPNS